MGMTELPQRRPHAKHPLHSQSRLGLACSLCVVCGGVPVFQEGEESIGFLGSDLLQQ